MLKEHEVYARIVYFAGETLTGAVLESVPVSKYVIELAQQHLGRASNQLDEADWRLLEGASYDPAYQIYIALQGLEALEEVYFHENMFETYERERLSATISLLKEILSVVLRPGFGRKEYYEELEKQRREQEYEEYSEREEYEEYTEPEYEEYREQEEYEEYQSHEEEIAEY